MENRYKEKKNVHAGHRQRQKGKFLEYGLDAFTDVEAIELLLYYALPRQDTNPLAHALLDRFHGFRGVLEAGPRELAEVEGVGEHAAALIALVSALNRRYFDRGRRAGAVLDSTEAAGEYLRRLYAYQKVEMAVLLCMDAGSRVQCWRVLSTGTASSVNIPVRDIVDAALRENAVRVILSHNHLSHCALPSNADLDTTQRLYYALKLIGVELVDHLIFSGEDFVSLRESNFFVNFH